MENLDYFIFNNIPLEYNEDYSLVINSDSFIDLIEKLLDPSEEWFYTKNLSKLQDRAKPLVDAFYKDPDVQKFIDFNKDHLALRSKWSTIIVNETCFILAIHDLIKSKWGFEIDLRKYLLQNVFEYIINCLTENNLTEFIPADEIDLVFYIKEPVKFSLFLLENGKELAEFEL